MTFLYRPYFVAVAMATSVLCLTGFADALADSTTLEAQGVALCAIANSLSKLKEDVTEPWCENGYLSPTKSDGTDGWCKWTGVTCDTSLLVTKLGLQGNSMTGTIPASISVLTSLTSLDLSSNSITGTIPPLMSALTGLTYLNLGTSYLSGPIPSTLSALTGLTYLNLGDNYLSGPIPSTLSALTKLDELLVKGTFLTGTIPSNLMNLKLYVYTDGTKTRLVDPGTGTTTTPASIIAQGYVLCEMYSLGLGGVSDPWNTCRGSDNKPSAPQYQKVSNSGR